MTFEGYRINIMIFIQHASDQVYYVIYDDKTNSMNNDIL